MKLNIRLLSLVFVSWFVGGAVSFAQLSSATGAHFAYSGDDGPGFWVEESPTCGGTRQSPVNIAGAVIDPELRALPLFLNETSFTLENNGHTVMAVPNRHAQERAALWREGSAGLLRARLAAVRVRCAHHDYGRARPHHEQWLLIEWPQGSAEPTQYWLANLADTTPLKQLVRLATLR